MTTKLYLTVVDDADPSADMILTWTGKPGEPMFTGDEPDENLACGACKTVLARHVSTRTLHGKFSTRGRLIIECGCGAQNLAPASSVSE